MPPYIRINESSRFEGKLYFVVSWDLLNPGILCSKRLLHAQQQTDHTIGPWQSAWNNGADIAVGGVFMLYRYALQLHHGQSIIPTKGVLAQPILLLVLSVFHQGRFGRLWFMWALAILYLLSPLLSRAFTSTRDAVRLALGLTAICVLSHAVDIWHILTTQTSMYSYNVNPWFRQTFKVWIFATYFVWGGVLGRGDVREYIRSRIPQWAAILVVVVMTAISVCYQMALDRYMFYNSPEYQHDSPIVILWVLSIMICFTCYGSKHSSSMFWNDLSKCTLGIYFLHGMTAFLLKHYLIPPISLMSLIVQAIATFAICYIVTITAMRIPVAKYFMAIPKLSLAKKHK